MEVHATFRCVTKSQFSVGIRSCVGPDGRPVGDRANHTVELIAVKDDVFGCGRPSGDVRMNIVAPAAVGFEVDREYLVTFSPLKEH